MKTLVVLLICLFDVTLRPDQCGAAPRDVINPVAIDPQTGPENLAVVASQTTSASMTCCKTNATITTSRVQWWEYGTRPGGNLISDGSTLLPAHPHYSRYGLTVSPDEKCYTLTINQINRNDAAKYVCVDVWAEAPETTQRGAQLVVIDENPMCTNTVLNEAIEGSIYSMECSVTFVASYPIAPIMTWTGPTPYNIQEVVSNTSVRSEIRFNANRTMDDQFFNMFMNFTSTGFGGTDMATNIPLYNYTWQSPPLRVRWPPSNMYIEPEEPELEIGDVLTCYCDANPPATYFWRAIGGPVIDQTWYNQSIELTIDMVGQNILRCNANNTINGISSSAIRSFNITVNPYNACSSSPCQYGGTCVRDGNFYICNCIPGVYGTNCENVVNNCVSLPCLNGGTCVHGINFYQCICHAEFTGTHCETELLTTTASY